MSCYEWERGTIRIPSNQWVGFRTAVIKAYNSHITGQYNAALRALEKARAAMKGKRFKTLEDKKRAYGQAISDAMTTRRWNGYNYEEEYDFDSVYKAQQACIKTEHTYETGYTSVKWRKPQKKAYPVKPTSKSCSIELGEAGITLSNSRKYVVWDVPENNRACDRARSHPVASKLFSLLSSIKWTSKTGGKILGNDEYNRDEGGEYEGGGGTYVKDEFSKKASERARAARRSYSNSYGC